MKMHEMQFGCYAICQACFTVWPNIQYSRFSQKSYISSIEHVTSIWLTRGELQFTITFIRHLNNLKWLSDRNGIATFYLSYQLCPEFPRKLSGKVKFIVKPSAPDESYCIENLIFSEIFPLKTIKWLSRKLRLTWATSWLSFSNVDILINLSNLQMLFVLRRQSHEVAQNSLNFFIED